jgi:multidrug efflux system membrane fusion protein
MVLLIVSFAVVASGGCQRPSVQVAPAEAPVLPVSKPVQRSVTDYIDFTGRTDAIEAVDVRPRVTGYLKRAPFREGSMVKKDDLLFEIDPRPYRAQLDQAIGQVNLYKAQLELAQTTYARDRSIANRVSGAVTQQQLDQDAAAVKEAGARIKAAEASTKVYKLNLDFTKVTSPIDGMVSRYFLTTGNLVNQDQTLLTTVVSLDPMHVYFDMDEPTLLRIRKAINSGTIKPAQAGNIPVLMGLQGEEGFPHRGTINFVNNQVNPATGSIAVRGVFSNPVVSVYSAAWVCATPRLTVADVALALWVARSPVNVRLGRRLLSPGMFVRVRLPVGQAHPALLVIDRAIGSDQGLKFLYVVDADNKIEYRRVTTGALQPDGLRVITQGLKPDERVLVGGLQQVRPHMKIQPEPRSMPTLGPAPPPPPKPEAPAKGGKKPEAPANKNKAQAPARRNKR